MTNGNYTTHQCIGQIFPENTKEMIQLSVGQWKPYSLASTVHFQYHRNETHTRASKWHDGASSTYSSAFGNYLQMTLPILRQVNNLDFDGNLRIVQSSYIYRYALANWVMTINVLILQRRVFFFFGGITEHNRIAFTLTEAHQYCVARSQNANLIEHTDADCVQVLPIHLYCFSFCCVFDITQLQTNTTRNGQWYFVGTHSCVIIPEFSPSAHYSWK